MGKLLLESYKTKDNNISFDLKFKDRITFINGDSGIGKTMLFKAIERDAILKKVNMLCLNYDDQASGNIEHTLRSAKNRVIVIDNADIVLDRGQRVQISMDTKNQYIIFTHSTQGFFPTKEGLSELVIDKSKGTGKLDYYLLEE